MTFHPPFTRRMRRRVPAPQPAADSQEEVAKPAVDLTVKESQQPAPPAAGASEKFPHWTARMRKAELLEIAHSVGLSELSMDNTKDEITDALHDAEAAAPEGEGSE